MGGDTYAGWRAKNDMHVTLNCGGDNIRREEIRKTRTCGLGLPYFFSGKISVINREALNLSRGTYTVEYGTVFNYPSLGVCR